MSYKEYLNEKKYQDNNKKISNIAKLILFGGILIGGALIVFGITKSNENKELYSEENRQKEITRIENEIEKEKYNLEDKKYTLIGKGVTYDAFTEYDDGESYDLKIITKALDPSFNNCAFDEYKNNNLTKKYCSLKSELSKVNSFNYEFEMRKNSSKSIPFYMFGAFIIISSCMFSFGINMITKRREILSYTMQQVMPVQEEVMEKMTPSLKEVAKEITKGINEGKK